MTPPVVWLNKYLSNTWEIVARLARERRPGEFRLLCTHPRPDYPARDHADIFEREPGGLRDAAYVDYCLSVARRHEVRLFLPGRKLLPVVRAAERFAALGTRVIAAGDAGTIALINNKPAVYAALAGDGFHLPDHEIVTDLAGFNAAWRRLRPRHELLCFKPAVSVYGLGFRVVVDREPFTDMRFPGDPIVITLNQARRELAMRRRFRDLMLMPYLPGPERSVDALALGGELLHCVVRRKEEGGQVLENNPALIEAVRRLTARFRLTNLFNVQFRDAAGTPYLLEINPRMSGGLPFSCESGVTLPLWAIRLAFDTATPADIPEPCTGIWVPQPEIASSR
jgi:hypothetical protein